MILPYVEWVQAEIELRKMRFVLAVAEDRSFTRAASRCHITQPVLSRRVQEVERVLGIKLFERQPRSLKVTEAGRLFLGGARRTLEESNRTVSLVMALAKQQERPLAIGVSLLADTPCFLPLIEKSRQSIAPVPASLHTAYTPELIRGLLRGDLDLAIIDLPSQQHGLKCHPLATEPLIAVLPEQFRSSHPQAIRLTELIAARMVLLPPSVDPARPVIDRAIAAAGPRAFKIHDAGSIQELLDQVALDGRAGLLRKSAARFERKGVVYKPMSEPIHVGSAVAWRADQRSPVVVSFRDAVIAFSPETPSNKE